MENQQVIQWNKPYSYHLAHDIVKPFFTNWKYPVMVIYGNPETGKTDTALLFAEIGKDLGVIDYFASNINTYGVGERITNLEDLKFWFEHQDGNKLYILDEAGMYFFSRDALSKLNRALIKEVMILRKFHAHIIFILQEIEVLDYFKHSELTGMIVKKKVIGNEFIALIKKKMHPDIIRVRDFPKTTIPYNTLDISPFTLEKEISEQELVLKGLPYKVAYLYAKYGNIGIITRELKELTGKEWKWMQVKRLLQKYLRETLRIEVKRGRPKKGVESCHVKENMLESEQKMSVEKDTIT